MDNNFLIAYLLNKQDYNLINLIYKKHLNELLNLGCYLRDNAFKFLPLSNDDFFYEIYESIKSLKNINLKVFNSIGYYKILKKIFVQKIIKLNKKFLNSKERILTTSFSYDVIYRYDFQKNTYSFLRILQDEYDWHESFNKKYDFINSCLEITNKFKKNKDKIFPLYLRNLKASQIAEITNIPIKIVYNNLFKIKHCLKEIYQSKE